ncbi:hypothetical protein AXG93_1860s1200 [Marchantia polymorpha subsp. ruderalis]|uniref:Uncharacterized protein n=1 Tax=Marchantia polymorpha subsp. ruderalis TaxID=1480154 RepID=A0A176VG66_MARPO|nr:hypothetical protein AXG93_1860s1200 [Marchantia polymorpha subsp. ruderalis]
MDTAKHLNTSPAVLAMDSTQEDTHQTTRRPPDDKGGTSARSFLKDSNTPTASHSQVSCSAEQRNSVTMASKPQRTIEVAPESTSEGSNKIKHSEGDNDADLAEASVPIKQSSENIDIDLNAAMEKLSHVSLEITKDDRKRKKGEKDTSTAVMYVFNREKERNNILSNTRITYLRQDFVLVKWTMSAEDPNFITDRYPLWASCNLKGKASDEKTQDQTPISLSQATRNDTHNTLEQQRPIRETRTKKTTSREVTAEAEDGKQSPSEDQPRPTRLQNKASQPDKSALSNQKSSTIQDTRMQYTTLQDTLSMRKLGITETGKGEGCAERSRRTMTDEITITISSAPTLRRMKNASQRKKSSASEVAIRARGTKRKLPATSEQIGSKTKVDKSAQVVEERTEQMPNCQHAFILRFGANPKTAT